MRFDDRLLTVLSQPAGDRHDAAVRGRQLADLVARAGPESDSPVVARALESIRSDAAEIDERLKTPRQNPAQPLYVSAPLPQTGRVMLKDENICVHCGLCAERCPTGAWDMQKSTVSIPYAATEAQVDEAQWQSSRKAG